MSACLLWFGLCALWKASGTQAAITINEVTLTVLPGNDVASGSRLTLRCEAIVSQSLHQLHTYTFKLQQDDQVIYTKNTSDSVVEYSLSSARVSKSGRYECKVRVYDKEKTSNIQTLKVTGLQTPMLKVKKDIVYEGDEIMATCSAPEETGSLMFYFYKDNQEVKRASSSGNSITTSLNMQKPTDVYLHCNYMVMMHYSAGFSNQSNTVKVIVQDLDITPQISISPKVNVVEGDRVQITCQILQYFSDLELYLTKGNSILNRSYTSFTHSLVVRAEDSGDYVCKAEKDSVQKTAVYRLNVKELFTKPILRMNPDTFFEGERFSLTCSSDVSSSDRIIKADIKYVLMKEDRSFSPQAKYDGTAILATNGKYSCMASAKGIKKNSLPLVLKAKVPVSVPVIRTDDNNAIIVGRPFKILCEAKNGTLPITYTLLKDRSRVDERRVVDDGDKAFFNINSISYPEEINRYTCEAHNRGPAFSRTSDPLRAPVIVPVSKPILEPLEITVTEGLDLVLICRVQHGSHPIAFTWYHNMVQLPNSFQEVRSSEGRHVVKAIQRDQKGDYFCRASNYASETKMSNPVQVGVSLAVWKKVLIGVFCILLLVVIVIVLTVFLKKMSNTHRKEQAAELSVKSSRAKSGDPMRVSLTLDIEDNTALNGTPCVMGRNVWSENTSGSDSDDHTDEGSELVQPQEVVHSRGADFKEVPVKKITEPETSVQHPEVQESTPGDSEQAEGQAALEYVQLNNSEQEPQNLQT